jgi:hypothetical protein
MLERREYFKEGFRVFTRNQYAKKDVMGLVVYAVDERNFLFVASNLHILAIHDENATWIPTK